MHRSLTLSLLGSLLLVSFLQAQPAAGDEAARLRDTLRSTLLQLRTAQADLATAQSANAALTEENKNVLAEVEKLKKEIIATRLAAEKPIAELTARVTGQTEQINRLQTSLADTRSELATSQAETVATEARRAQLATALAAAERKGEDLVTKNLALYRLGSEILVRYEKFSFGDALSNREPFIGTAKVKLENLIQDYAERLAEARAASTVPLETATAQAAVSSPDAETSATENESSGNSAPRRPRQR